MPSWSLQDPTDTARASRYTFFKSSPDEIAKVVAGEVVKLIFVFDSTDPDAPRAERMWVKVSSIGPGGAFTGLLDNDPRWIQDLKAGDRIDFSAFHIINTQHDSNDNLVEKYLPRCFVTSRVLHDGEPIGYLYREEPDFDRDSGWRILAGDESDEYMEDSKNLHFVSLGAVLNRDDSIVSLLDSSTGAAFTRDETTGGFVLLED